MEKYYFNNGLSAYYYPNTALHSVCIGMYINVGSRNETKETNGISHLLEHMHFRRLGKLNQSELYDYTDKIGSTLMAATYKEFTRYFIRLRPRFILQALKLFKDILEFYEWTEDDLINEKNVVLNELTSKQRFINTEDEIDARLWRASSMSLPIIGKEDSVRNISLGDLCAYKHRHYTGSNTAFVFTGNLLRNDIESINKFISSVKCYAGKKGEEQGLHFTSHSKPDVHFVSCHDNYYEVNIIFDVGDIISSEIQTLLNCIVGDGTTSLLQRELRERLCLTDDIHSDNTFYSDNSFIRINYSVAEQNFYSSLKSVVEVLNSSKISISESTLASNILFYVEDLWYLFDDVDSLNFEVGWELHVGNRQEYSIDNKILTYSNIKPVDLKDAAKSIFRSPNLTVCVMGRTGKLTKKAIREIFGCLDN